MTIILKDNYAFVKYILALNFLAAWPLLYVG